MGVPNTTTFSMQDVSNTVDPSKSQLTQLITVANAQSTSLWDATYSGSKNSLLNFRNYGNSALTPFSGSQYSTSTQDACSKLPQNTFYHNGVNIYPVSGNTLYLNGVVISANWIVSTYISSDNATVYQTNSNGVVISITYCPRTSGPTLK
tara:strand:+ start:153 stop:602 length:450 start_codon:yes stop_codon:yes gene_type:complete